MHMHELHAIVTIINENFLLVFCKGHVLRVREPPHLYQFSRFFSSNIYNDLKWVSLLHTMVFHLTCQGKGIFTKINIPFMFSILLILPSCHYPNPLLILFYGITCMGSFTNLKTYFLINSLWTRLYSMYKGWNN